MHKQQKVLTTLSKLIGAAICVVSTLCLILAHNAQEVEKKNEGLGSRIDRITEACEHRFSSSNITQELALRAAEVVPIGKIILVAILIRKKKQYYTRQHDILANVLRKAGGGSVQFSAFFLGKQSKNATRRAVWRQEALVRNEILEKINQDVAVVIMTESSALWCAEDVFRLIATLHSADASCGEFLEPDPRFVHLVSEENPSTCEAIARGSTSAPRDSWTGDILPRRLSIDYDSQINLFWPARVFACWSGLVALRAEHVIQQNGPPPLRFRVAKRSANECDSPPPAQFILDLHRRVQESRYGAHAVVLSDPGAIIAYSAQRLSSAPVSNLPEISTLASSHALLEPLEMPRTWRCCRDLSCNWRPTHLDQVHDSLTASALYKRSQKNRKLLFFGHKNRKQKRRHRRFRRRRKNDQHRSKLARAKKKQTDSSLFQPKTYLRNGKREQKLPKFLSNEYNKSGIPLTIYQSFSTREEELPSGLKKAANTWRNQNPEFDYKYFNDSAMFEYVVTHFGERELEALKIAPSGAHRADLWRYLVIGREGGIYADIDTLCEQPIRNWLGNEKGVLIAALQADPRFDLSQWAFGAPPGNPVVLRAAKLAVNNLLLARNSKKIPSKILQAANGIRGLRRVPSAQSIHGFDLELRFDCPELGATQRGHDGAPLTGPPVFQLALETEALARAGLSAAKLGPHLATIPFVNKRRHLQTAFRELISLRPPNFGGAVNPKYTDEESYRAELKLAHVRHWSTDD